MSDPIRDLLVQDVSRLRCALVRELKGATRASLECQRQGNADFARHFDRMAARIAKVLEQGDSA